MTEKKQTFESALTSLKTIVEQLESGSLSLDDSIEAYKKGIVLSQYCQDQLNEAKESIATVVKDDGEETSFELEK